ncbi:phospholipase [Dysgonomonas sp. 216]|uniref:phospholipase n=1 Tax=Dysgonomonas sp. 216 TaxID=2302934 RepID=UPI0013D22EE8|nr:phospholipase [Dysgonomonas sp. 216]NDW18971.1 phospholipase [Dysgonomonas sp. 216]
MEILFIFLGLIFFFVLSLFIWNTMQVKRGNTEKLEEIESDPVDGECCGKHATCEKDSLLSAFSEEIEYFDDEELDAYKGLSSDRYSEKDVEEFRSVLYSMYDEDKPRWVRSLQLRNISIPDQLKDEVFMFVNELRASR